MARVVWTREALANLELIRAYIQQFDPGAAQRMARRLIEAGDSLRTFPQRVGPWQMAAESSQRSLPTSSVTVSMQRTFSSFVFVTGVKTAAKADLRHLLRSV